MLSKSEGKARPAPAVESLVTIIDKLRDRQVEAIKEQLQELEKRADAQRGTRPHDPTLVQERKRLRALRKRYGVEAINVNGLTSFRNLRYGKVQYPPPREAIIALADYLGCTLLQKNRLLLSVGYQPLQVWLERDELDSALTPHRHTLNYLPIPGFIINRDWSILGANAAFFRLFAVQPDVFDRAMPGHANLLRMIFDPDYPFYHRLNNPNSADDSGWQVLAAANVRAFKQQNYLSWEEPWYTAVRDTLKQDIATFSKIWEETNIDTPINGMGAAQHTFPIYRPDEIDGSVLPIRLMSVHLTTGDFDYPQLLAYLPTDNAARHAFTRIGLPVPENGWSTDARIIPAANK